MLRDRPLSHSFYVCRSDVYCDANLTPKRHKRLTHVFSTYKSVKYSNVTWVWLILVPELFPWAAVLSEAHHKLIKNLCSTADWARPSVYELSGPQVHTWPFTLSQAGAWAMKELLHFCADQTEGFYEFKGTTRGTCSAEYQFSFGNRVNKCFSIWKIQFSSQPFFFFLRLITLFCSLRRDGRYADRLACNFQNANQRQNSRTMETW